MVLGDWMKLMTVSPTNPLRTVYGEMYRLSAAGHTTWCTHVGDLVGCFTAEALPKYG